MTNKSKFAQGGWQGDSEEDALSGLQGHSITYRIAMGAHRGRKAFMLQTLASAARLGVRAYRVPFSMLLANSSRSAFSSMDISSNSSLAGAGTSRR